MKKPDWKKPSREEIIQLYVVEQQTVASMCRHFNIPSTSMHRIIENYNIPKQKNHKHNLLGRRFDKLVIIGESDKPKNVTSTYWECQCDCGNITRVDSNRLLSGKTKSCGCYRGCFKYEGFQEISKTYWSRVLKSAEIRSLTVEFDIGWAWTLYIKQDKKCALSGVNIYFARNYANNWKKQTASLDRIDSSKGYTKDNVQWIHKELNWLKQNYNQEYIIEVMETVLRHQKPEIFIDNTVKDFTKCLKVRDNGRNQNTEIIHQF